MSAHSLPSRRGWLSAVAARVATYVFEEVDEPAVPEPIPLVPKPVVAVVSAAPRSGASTVARLLAAELAARADGAACVIAPGIQRRPAPPSRAAIRLTTALAGAVVAQPCGRLCLIPSRALDPPGGEPRGGDPPGGADPALPDPQAGSRPHPPVEAARYLAPVVLDLPPDGSAAGVAGTAEHVIVVGSGDSEPALIDAVAHIVGGDPIKLANRVADPEPWAQRIDHTLPDSRVAVQAAAIGTRALGELGARIAAVADAIEGRG